MKKYNNYKKYYESHKEQEKKRTNTYYHEHRDEILAKQKAKRDAIPKVKKPTLREQLKIAEKALEFACNFISTDGYCFGNRDSVDCLSPYETGEGCIICMQNFYKNKAKEYLKNE